MAYRPRSRRSYAAPRRRAARGYTQRARRPGIRRAASRTSSRTNTVRIVLEHSAPTMQRVSNPFQVQTDVSPRKAPL